MAWNRAQGDFIINRFPVCAAWYYAVAKYLGYSDDEAKSLAMARATFFAAAKQGFRKGGSGNNKGGAGGIPALPGEGPNLDTLNFCGLAATVDTDTGLAIFGGEVQIPAKYDNGVLNKFVAKVGMAGYIQLITEMTKLIEQHTKMEMNSNAAYKLYTSIRDEFRKREFFNTEIQVA
jgi:hypothetical protein